MFKPFDFKNSDNILSLSVCVADEFGCNAGLDRNNSFLVFVDFSITSDLKKELETFNLLAIERINSLFSLFFPCLKCLPINANS